MKSTTCSTPPSSSNRVSLAAHRSSPHDTAPRYSARTVPFVVAATRRASPKVTRPISPRTAPMPKLPASRVETSDPAVENVRYNLDAGSHMVIWPASPRSSKARADRSSFGPSPSRPNVTTSAPRWNPCTKGSTGVRTQMIPSFSITSAISQRSASADSQVISSESMLIDPGSLGTGIDCCRRPRWHQHGLPSSRWVRRCVSCAPIFCCATGRAKSSRRARSIQVVLGGEGWSMSPGMADGCWGMADML